MYDITISYAINGFVCQVGCQRVVFENMDSMLAAMRKYFTDPETTKKKWIENRMFKHGEDQLGSLMNTSGAAVARSGPGPIYPAPHRDVVHMSMPTIGNGTLSSGPEDS